jgi:hypothetical protein
VTPREFRAKASAWYFGVARCPFCGGAPRLDVLYDGSFRYSCCEDYDCEDGKYTQVGGIVAHGRDWEDCREEWNAQAQGAR